VAVGLQLPDVFDHAHAVWAFVDVISQEEEFVVVAEVNLLEEFAEGGGAAVDVGDGVAGHWRKGLVRRIMLDKREKFYSSDLSRYASQEMWNKSKTQSILNPA